MKRKIFSFSALLMGFFGFSQTEVYFKYDEAGNQRYRGTNNTSKKASDETKKESQETRTIAPLQQNPAMDEKTFWKQIRLYPVPVNDILTIDWTNEADGLIESVALYQHNTINWKFRKQNMPDLNKEIKINISGYDWGVYILQFTLKDGRIFSRNVTKR
ncbi:T9SS type A sorting domain-containing protein [Chryseobacterium sp. CKR4-1]|uniref:T9SS type A sorting domain-containing protein n=1 Tax=Chryseobacterium sp. CKR4-1 TaxID=3068896 RepID=UPI002796C030|nr:T9SS type A sorting domain-containing protein [Chryseobacterium sp. CKR4-1]MDQ1806592.1 T9SS type A sorting domain-containing protein [Chryseobacterium sp. CKR4-1]